MRACEIIEVKDWSRLGSDVNKITRQGGGARGMFACTRGGLGYRASYSAGGSVGDVRTQVSGRLEGKLCWQVRQFTCQLANETDD